MEGKLQTEMVIWPSRWLGMKKRNGEWQAGSSGQGNGRGGGGQSRVGHLKLLVLRMHAMLA